MSNKKRERLLLVGALICLLGFAGDRFLLGPLLAPWKARSEKITQLEQQIVSGQMLLDRQDAIKDRWKEMQQGSLPADQSAAENQVLNAVGQWARTSQLDVTDMKPHWVSAEDSPTHLEIEVSAKGGMASIARFLFELERSPLALRLEDVEIRAKDERGTDLTLDTRFTGVVLPQEKSS